MSEITKEMVLTGLQSGIVHLIEEMDSVVCQIGEYWFYFGDNRTNFKTPDEFLKENDFNEIAKMIVKGLEDIRDHLSETEYNYYFACLSEKGGDRS